MSAQLIFMELSTGEIHNEPFPPAEDWFRAIRLRAAALLGLEPDSIATFNPHFQPTCTGRTAFATCTIHARTMETEVLGVVLVESAERVIERNKKFWDSLAESGTRCTPKARAT